MEENRDVKDFYENIYEEKHREERETLEFTRSKIIISRYLKGYPLEIADICGATGAYSFWLANMGHKVHLLDLAQNHIEIAKQKSEENQISLASFSCADARNLPYSNESMDLILLMGALYHLQSLESRSQCLREAFRVLKCGGTILCTVISRYIPVISALKYNLINHFGMESIEETLSTGISKKSNLPLLYCHKPDDIVSEMTNVGFNNIQPIAVEGIANAIGENKLPEDMVSIEQLLRCIELTESVPELLGVSRNIMVVGRKPDVSTRIGNR